MEWVLAVLPYIGGGVVGSTLTYLLSWVRERRRTLDAYRAPQRQAVGQIVAATHEYMLRELEQRTVMAELIESLRVGEDVDSPDQIMATSKAMGVASLAVEQAFQAGVLTIVDAPCWEAMGLAYSEFDQHRKVVIGAKDMDDAAEFEAHSAAVTKGANQFNARVSELVKVAVDQLAPVESIRNRRRRNASRERIRAYYEQILVRTSEPPPS